MGCLCKRRSAGLASPKKQEPYFLFRNPQCNALYLAFLYEWLICREFAQCLLSDSQYRRYFFMAHKNGIANTKGIRQRLAKSDFYFCDELGIDGMGVTAVYPKYRTYRGCLCERISLGRHLAHDTSTFGELDHSEYQQSVCDSAAMV